MADRLLTCSAAASCCSASQQLIPRARALLRRQEYAAFLCWSLISATKPGSTNFTARTTFWFDPMDMSPGEIMRNLKAPGTLSTSYAAWRRGAQERASQGPIIPLARSKPARPGALNDLSCRSSARFTTGGRSLSRTVDGAGHPEGPGSL